MTTAGVVDERLISTFGRLAETYTALERSLGETMQGECGIPHTWFEVLLRISRSPDGLISMGALAGQIALTGGGVTRLLDRMIVAGLVERVPCPTDRRIYYAALTPQGVAKLGECKIVHAQGLRRVFSDFSPAELDALDEYLVRLRAPGPDG
jgi:DNA-binding MarR family transcriptional regulator